MHHSDPETNSQSSALISPGRPSAPNEFARNFLGDSLGTRDHHSPIISDQEKASTQGPSTLLSLSSDLPTDHLSTEMNNTPVQSNQAMDTTKLRPTLQLLDNHPSAINRGKELRIDSPGISVQQPTIHDNIIAVPSTILSLGIPRGPVEAAEKLISQTPPINTPEAHNKITVENSNFHPNPTHSSEAVDPFELRVGNQHAQKWPLLKEKEKMMTQPTLNLLPSASTSNSEGLTPSQKYLKYNKISGSNYSNQPSSITLKHAEAGPSSDHLQLTPEKKRKMSDYLTGSSPYQRSLIEQSNPIGYQRLTIPLTQQEDMKITDIFVFDEEVFKHKQYNSKKYEAKVNKIISKIRSLHSDDHQLKIPNRKPRDVALFFQSLGRSGGHDVQMKIQMMKHNPSLSQTEIISKLRLISRNERRDLIRTALGHLEPHKTLWFRFWKERTGINFGKLIPSQVPGSNRLSVEYTARDLALLIFQIDTIGTVLCENDLANLEKIQDYGARLLQEAESLIGDQIKSNLIERSKVEYSNDRYNTMRDPEESVRWVWFWMKQFLEGSKEVQLKKIFFQRTENQINELAKGFCTDVFIYSIENLNTRLANYYTQIELGKVPKKLKLAL
ncbi:hypothetical protein PGT21_033348 [Puccinia graminis f. sp. tritici]|uniref:Uncharacterized protein n=1 Tax=Puccinia graminis f. sp. tritici TaxID=56615 RepID=A0A5B0NUB1_PUCGR|nr:hypothetical protein PGTUg99_034842 [Puccinia graminis f. sp. tritici]KAA1091419.1 hypothetical protein PGT21_033348 [Puccinia graminis f. sp. tritici]